jgi:pimeloyl-ACP methyl ester carboxylesterase
MKTTTAMSSIAIVLLLGALESAAAQGLRPPAPGPVAGRATVGGVELEYEARGTGEPVVLVHAGIFASWFKPLLGEPALAARYRLVSYHRVGYAGSGRIAGPVSLAQQATQLRELMRHLGIPRAHLVGHSSGGNIALQLALDDPDAVQSIVLMEPALPVPNLGPERMLSTRAAMAPSLQAYKTGDKARAVDGFMRGVAGPEYRAALDQGLPGAFAQGVADADTFFGQELPAILQWSLKREDAARIRQPVLSIMGARSPAVSPIWTDRHELILGSFPRAEGFVLPEATHLLHVQQPRAAAEALAAFFARHPVPAR